MKGAWSPLPAPHVPNDYLWAFAAVDPRNGRVMLPNGYVENEQLVLKALLGALAETHGLRDTSERRWLTEKSALLGDTPPNVTLNRPPPPRFDHPNREGVRLSTGIVKGADMYVPFSLDAFTYLETPVRYQGKTLLRKRFETEPFANGVFYSSDLGKTWRLEMISNKRGLAPALCQTTGYLYYFSGPFPLWFSRKAGNAEVWESPQPITKTSHGIGAFYGVAGDGDTAHICWMDRRHNKWRFSFNEPAPINSDIYYRRRKDGDAEWNKEVWLSKGLMYCYAPTIAAVGDKVVVVWAGIRKAGRWHYQYGPNDIYYVTSKDGGKTWTRPLKVTDGAKDGSTAGMPQVALLNGTIHLLYTQGSPRAAAELSPGLTKLGMDPWPIYYTQRAFPH